MDLGHMVPTTGWSDSAIIYRCKKKTAAASDGELLPYNPPASPHLSNLQ